MCSGIMQQKISLCGVYFESLFNYMEQRSSKERRGLLASSMGLLVKGRDLPIDMFFIHPSSRDYSCHGRYRLVTDLFPQRSSDGGKNMEAVAHPTAARALRRAIPTHQCARQFFFTLFLLSSSLLLLLSVPKGPVDISVAQFCSGCARPLKHLGLLHNGVGAGLCADFSPSVASVYRPYVRTRYYPTKR